MGSSIWGEFSAADSWVEGHTTYHHLRRTFGLSYWYNEIIPHLYCFVIDLYFGAETFQGRFTGLWLSSVSCCLRWNSFVFIALFSHVLGTCFAPAWKCYIINQYKLSKTLSYELLPVFTETLTVKDNVAVMKCSEACLSRHLSVRCTEVMRWWNATSIAGFHALKSMISAV